MSGPGPIESGPLAMRDLPVPEPKAGEVRVRVLACAICRTDLHIVEGDLPPVRESGEGLPKESAIIGTGSDMKFLVNVLRRARRLDCDSEDFARHGGRQG